MAHIIFFSYSVAWNKSSALLESQGPIKLSLKSNWIKYVVYYIHTMENYPAITQNEKIKKKMWSTLLISSHLIQKLWEWGLGRDKFFLRSLGDSNLSQMRIWHFSYHVKLRTPTKFLKSLEQNIFHKRLLLCEDWEISICSKMILCGRL